MQRKEPEINPLKTSSMSTWNTGELAAKQQMMQQPVRQRIDKHQALRAAIQRYHEQVYMCYSHFIVEITALGFCVTPQEPTNIGEIGSSEYVNENGIIRSRTTYADHKRKQMMNEKRPNDFDYGNPSKRPKAEDDEDSRRIDVNNNSKKIEGDWSDEEPCKISSRSTSNWDDDDRRSQNGDRYRRERFDGNDRRGGYRGRGGRGRGSGGFDRERNFDNKTPRNSRFGDKPKSSAITLSSGWSDDESDDKSKTTAASDGWNDEPVIKPPADDWDAAPAAKAKTDDWGVEVPAAIPQTPVSSQKDDDDWD